jgi:hypothetical protein
LPEAPLSRTSRRVAEVSGATLPPRLLRFLDETATVGWFAGNDRDLNVELVFASIAKLSWREHLPRLH